MSLFVDKYKNYIVKNECAFHYGVVPSARLQLQSTKIILGLSPITVLYYAFLIYTSNDSETSKDCVLQEIGSDSSDEDDIPLAKLASIKSSSDSDSNVPFTNKTWLTKP